MSNTEEALLRLNSFEHLRISNKSEQGFIYYHAKLQWSSHVVF